MKKIIMIATVLVVVFPFLAFSQSEGYYSGSYTRLSYVKGDVYIQRAQDLGYEKGEVNLVVIAGDKLGTREGRAEIQLGRRNYLRLDRDTLVDMVNLPSRDGDLTKLHLISGSIYVRVNNLDREKNFEIHTPDASFYLMQEGLYRVDILESKETEFRAYSGSAEAAAEEGSVLVRDGEQITAANGRFASSPGSLYSRRDDFGDWNAGRDAIFARRLTKTYLPEDYSDYESELSSYGRWAYEAPYGNVWVPTISDYDWRPYYNGRWVWYPIIGWTWVSYEPWGWCTSHYGRWGWRFGLGWYWIPQHHWGWGPAWVHWYHGYDHYGWCALSYYNRPAVFINNRFYDRYDRDYFPANSRSLVVVHRNQLQSPRLRQAALNQTAVERLGRIQLQASQPNIGPAFSRDSAVSAGAMKTLSRENLREVGKGFVSGQRQLNPQEIRSSIQNRIRDSRASGSSGASPGKAVANKDLERFKEERGIRRQDPNLPSQIPQRNDEGVSSGTIKSRKDTQDSFKPMSGSEMKREIRSFPSQRSSELPSSGSQVRSGELSPSRAKEFSAPKIEERGSRNSLSIRESQDRGTIRSYPSRKSEGQASSPSSSFRSSGAREERKIEERAITPRFERKEPSLNPSESRFLREYQPRSSGSSSSRDDAMGRMIQERSSSREAPPVQSPSRSAIKERGSSERGGSPNGFLSSYESRSSSSSRSTSAPSRSYSSPSRSYSSSAPSYSAPSRSYSSPSRSYSAPSRSFSSPSRSSSAPSRSFSAPSRSSSGSSSRSSSGISRGSSSRSSSSSSSGSGRVRRK